jgi:hypothetical protein
VASADVSSARVPVLLVRCPLLSVPVIATSYSWPSGHQRSGHPAGCTHRSRQCHPDGVSGGRRTQRRESHASAHGHSLKLAEETLLEQLAPVWQAVSAAMKPGTTLTWPGPGLASLGRFLALSALWGMPGAWTSGQPRARAVYPGHPNPVIYVAKCWVPAGSHRLVFLTQKRSQKLPLLQPHGVFVSLVQQVV